MMALTETLSADTKQRIAQSLDSFIPTKSTTFVVVEAHKADAPQPRDETYLGESFPVWSAAVDELVTPVPMTKLASWHQVWHHQIRGTKKGTAIAYSRTREVEANSSHEVLGLFYSKLAGEIDEGIDWIDNEHPEFGDDWAARLLTIPEIELTAIWLLQGEESWFVPLDRLRDKPGARTFHLINEVTFREECRNRPKIDDFRSRPIDQPPLMKLAPTGHGKALAKSSHPKGKGKGKS